MQDHRYSRQERVPQIGQQGQSRLAQAKVVVVGAGGLGCVAAPLLVGAGVGTTVLVDHDSVSESNLHRQTLYREADIGLPKAEVAQRELSGLNSSVAVAAVVQSCHPDNVFDLIADADVVLDAADNFAVSYLLSDACQQTKTVLISASVNRTYGYVGAFCGRDSLALASFRSVFPLVPDQQMSCDIVGVTGPSVAAIAAVQAQETLKYLSTESIDSTLWQFELWDYSVHGIQMNAQRSEQPSTPNIPFIGASRANELSARALIVDVREADEVANAALPYKNVVNIPLAEIGPATSLPAHNELVFACRSGQRALIAAQRMAASADSLAVLLPSH